MRFLIKTAFWLALIAFFLPSPQSGEGEAASVNYFGAFLGAQEAISDMGGFCERSPAACAAGRDVGTYVASRVGDGLVYAYSLARASGVEVAEPATAEAPALAVSARDPMETAAVAAERVRQATGLNLGQAMPAAPQAPATAEPVAAPTVTIVPTPAPRA
jgi:hypothetical protein